MPFKPEKPRARLQRLVLVDRRPRHNTTTLSTAIAKDAGELARIDISDGNGIVLV